MADNVAVTAGSGTTVAADEVVDATLGTVKVQIIKIMDGTLDSTNKLVVDSHGSAQTTLKDASGNAVAFLPNATANGATSSRVVSGASNNLTNLKTSAGNIYEIDVFNVAAYTVFLKIYNKASAPVVASDTPTWTIPIAAGTGYSKSFAFGKSFATGIAYAIVKLQADTDPTNVAAGDLTGSIDWA